MQGCRRSILPRFRLAKEVHCHVFTSKNSFFNPYPVMRGTFWALSERTGYLFGSGVVPRLGTYPGAESPVPLRIDIQHGASDIYQVARDILALTKLNYNECKIGDSEPVTIGFSGAVGEILVSNPTVLYRSPKFKFYI